MSILKVPYQLLTNIFRELHSTDSSRPWSGSFSRCLSSSYSINRTPEIRRSVISTKHAPPMNGSQVITDLIGVPRIIAKLKTGTLQIHDLHSMHGSMLVVCPA